jgi:2-keto-4-pentenoate hydratase/2-oxohepta-3-ene-1,7-dioic acid hydratase in catechol pathway
MKLVTVTSKGVGRVEEDWVGVLLDSGGGAPDEVVDIKRASAHFFPDEDGHFFDQMLTVIEKSEQSLPLARNTLAALWDSECRSPFVECVSEVVFKSPVPIPPQIRDCLLFEEHLKNAYAGLRKTRADLEPDPKAAFIRFEQQGLYQIPDVWYEIPLYYKANRFSVIGHKQEIIKPHYTSLLDFELEFGCFLSRAVKDVNSEEAESSIFGYSIFNDISARDVQSKEMQGQLGPTKSKDFDTGNVIGPCIVTADSLDPYNCIMIAKINGVEVCRGHSSAISRKFGDVISYMSQSETLVAGEFIGSGTVGGGCGLEIGRYLDVGDEIQLEVEGIGILTNKIVAD